MSIENAHLTNRLNKMRKAKIKETRSDYQKQYYEEQTKIKRRFQQLKKTYGITQEQYEAVLVYQGNKCGICRCDEPRRGWHLDHCHATGVIRGILCPPCNALLGHARDNCDTLFSAFHYLKRQGYHSENES